MLSFVVGLKGGLEETNHKCGSTDRLQNLLILKGAWDLLVQLNE